MKIKFVAFLFEVNIYEHCDDDDQDSWQGD